MAGIFIDIEVTPQAAEDPAITAKLTEVCPVDIYAQDNNGHLRIIEANLDECVLCRLCINATPPGSITIRKLYDDGATL